MIRLSNDGCGITNDQGQTMTPTIVSFGEWVREKRKQRGLTQKALGKMIGYAEVTIRQIEKDSYALTRFVVECIVNGLADQYSERDSIIRLALEQSQDNYPSFPNTIRNYRSGMPFFGRVTELDYLFKLLRAPDCGCISIIGVGGVGKTRLALKAIETLDPKLFQTVYFVNLTNVTTTELVPSAIAEALEIPLSPFIPPFEQIIQVLKTRKSLLVLDNFEQLLPDGVAFVRTIFESAPSTKLLITSRERLNFNSEWCVKLDGLDTSQHTSTTSEADDLFINAARRINHRFVVSDLSTVLKICQILQGIPLAIEMAASWTSIHSGEEILQSISMQMLELTTRQQGFEDRHQNLRVVFETTWTKLSLNEQSALKAISIFRGGFTADAAKKVATTSNETISFLQDKMLIQKQGDDRLVLHEMIRQLALEKLALNDDELAQAKMRHAEFFVEMLSNSTDRLKYHHTKNEILRLTADIENLREMWALMCQKHNTNWFYNTWESLWLFFNITSRFTEGEALFRSVLTTNASRNTSNNYSNIQTFSQIFYALFIFRQGRIPEAYDMLFSDRLNTFRKTASLENQYWIYLADSYVLHAAGDGATALSRIESAKEVINLTGNDPFAIAGIYYHLGRIQHLIGDIINAAESLSEAVRICRQYGCIWGIGLILTELGFLAEADNRLSKALNYYESVLVFATQLEDLWNYQRTQISIGRLKLALGNTKEAIDIQIFTLEALLDNPTLGFEIDSFVEIAQILKYHGEIQLACAVLEYCAANPECFQPIRDRATAYMTAIRVDSPNLDISVARNLLPAKKSELAIMLLTQLKRLEP